MTRCLIFLIFIITFLKYLENEKKSGRCWKMTRHNLLCEIYLCKVTEVNLNLNLLFWNQMYECITFSMLNSKFGWTKVSTTLMNYWLVCNEFFLKQNVLLQLFNEVTPDKIPIMYLLMVSNDDLVIGKHWLIFV